MTSTQITEKTRAARTNVYHGSSYIDFVLLDEAQYFPLFAQPTAVSSSRPQFSEIASLTSSKRL